MPTYVYEVILPNDEGGEQFEVVQSMSDTALTEHPETGEPVRRVIQPPFIGGKWSDGAMHKSANDNKKLEKLGFTKYEKAGDGVYERTAGKEGPRVFSRDRPIKPDELK